MFFQSMWKCSASLPSYVSLHDPHWICIPPHSSVMVELDNWNNWICLFGMYVYLSALKANIYFE